jgi:uncharacterized membrane protein YjjP (DUF1212 family)
LDPKLPLDADSSRVVRPNEAVDVVLWFGALMLQSGNTAARTREWMEVLGGKLMLERLSVGLTLDGVTVSVPVAGGWLTAIREIKPPAINASRIGQLEELARSLKPGAEAREVATRLAAIDSRQPRYSVVELVVAVALASASFAFLNGGNSADMVAAGIGGGIGQCARAWLSLRLNYFAVAALTAVAASGSYVLAAPVTDLLGMGLPHPAGIIASVLFLVPGFPLIAALFDLLQHHNVAAVSRFAHGVMALLAVALGLSVVVAFGRIDLSPQPPLDLAYPMRLLFRAIASFVAAAAFAMLFNCSFRTILAVGLLGLAANELRLVLVDFGMMLAPAAFLAALVIGLVALLVDRRFNLPRLAMTVPAIIIMVPGVYAYQMIVLFNRGQVLEALEASAAFGFVIGALAMGLASARVFRA